MHLPARIWFVTGSLLGGIGVTAGAFGAHSLKDFFLENGQGANWETAVRYCLFHAVVLLVVGLASVVPAGQRSRGRLTAAGACFLAGTLIFSGLLGVLALTGLRVLGAIVPIGGALLIAGWGMLAAAGFQLASEA